MDSFNLYPLEKPFRYEDRSKRTKNPFTVKNVAGAMGAILLDRKKVPAATSGQDWDLYSPWVEDTRNLWFYYKIWLNVAAEDSAVATDVAEQEPDYLWAGNVAGFIYLTALSWNDDDDEMQLMRYMIRNLVSVPSEDEPKHISNHIELMLLFSRLLWDINRIGAQEIEKYEAQNTYVSLFPSLRRGPYTQGQYSKDDEDYRKALFVDIVAHILETVKQKDQGLRKIALKVKRLEIIMNDISEDLFANMLRLQLKKATGEPAGQDYTELAGDISYLLKRIDKKLSA